MTDDDDDEDDDGQTYRGEAEGAEIDRVGVRVQAQSGDWLIDNFFADYELRLRVVMRGFALHP
jgi:hypothetical protein